MLPDAGRGSSGGAGMIFQILGNPIYPHIRIHILFKNNSYRRRFLLIDFKFSIVKLIWTIS